MGQTTVMVIVIAALGLAEAGFIAVLYQVIRQQGRLLLRLDQVERRLGLGPQALGAGIERGGSELAVGTVLPGFELPDLAAKPVALEDFRGRRVLLVHWSARCGFCDRIASELAALGPQHERAGVQMLLVSSGPATAERELAREHGIECPILLDGKGSAAVEAFAGLGTPSAYLLDEAGRVVQPLAVGADQVTALARLAAEGSAHRRTRLPGERPLAESRIERNGLRAGTSAPDFELPEVRGGTVSLLQHRGRKTLLVFSDPHCGPCEELAPHLICLHEAHRNNGLDLLLVSRGDLEENRRRAVERGFEFPVGVQRRWELSRQYGIFSTPVGFLIDEEGVVAQDAARGIDEILVLASQATAVTNGKGAVP
jgi:peroxiredoxin